MLVDIVPNHVGVATPALSVWWWDVLRRGRESEHAVAFDIDWAVGGGKIRLPILGDGDDELDALQVVDGELRYYEHRFPIADGTGDGTAAAGARPSALRADELPAGRCRAELPAVLRDQHAGRDQGRAADGLRASRTRRSSAGSTRAGSTGCGSTTRTGSPTRAAIWTIWPTLIDHRYVLVEKIIEGDETLPADWACAGTTGYEALAALDRLFVDPAGEPVLDDLDTELRGGLRVDWPAMTTATKRAVADGILRSEVLRLARLVPDDRRRRRRDRRAAQFLLRCTGPTCRSAASTWTRPSTRACAQPAGDRRRRFARSPTGCGDVGTEFSVRFQQTSGMVMAKGVEDCAFYRWTRLTSLTEVGGEPAQFSLDPQATASGRRPIGCTAPRPP